LEPSGGSDKRIRRHSLLGGLRLLGGCLLLAAAAVWAAPAGVAQAAEPAVARQSEADVLVARAIVAYDEKRYQDALAALQEALQLTPENVDALYYTGLVHAALRQLDQAAAALEKARALNPTDPSIQFQLGIVYFGQGNYEKAQPLLEQAFATNPKLDGLGYYVGFMRYRSKDYQGAVNAFRAGASTDPNIQQLTAFYTGLAFGILGLPERASSEISDALRLQPASPLTGPAERMRDTVRAAREGVERPYQIAVRLGGVYDDNVAVIPNKSPDPLVQILRSQRHRSPGWLGNLSASYNFLPAMRKAFDLGNTNVPDLTASGSVFTTQYSDINSLSLVDWQAGLGSSYRNALETPFGLFPFQASVQYNYDFLTLGGDEFVSRHTVLPVFSLVENQNNVTALQGRYQHKRFAFSSQPIQAEKRDGSNYMIGFIHLVNFQGGRHYLKAGYQADWDLTQGTDFTYFGHRALAGGQYTFFPRDASFPKDSWGWFDISLNYDFDVHFRAYRNFNTLLPVLAPNTIRRGDTEYNHIVRVTYPLTGNVPFIPPAATFGNFSLIAEFQATRTKSNLDVFSYDRNFASLSLAWTY